MQPPVPVRRCFLMIWIYNLSSVYQLEFNVQYLIKGRELKHCGVNTYHKDQQVVTFAAELTWIFRMLRNIFIVLAHFQMILHFSLMTISVLYLSKFN